MTLNFEGQNTLVLGIAAGAALIGVSMAYRFFGSQTKDSQTVEEAKTPDLE